MNNKSKNINFYKEIKNNNACLLKLIEDFFDVYEIKDKESDTQEKLSSIEKYNKNMKLTINNRIDMVDEFEIRRNIKENPRLKIDRKGKRIKNITLKIDDFKIKAKRKEGEETKYEFDYKELNITDESIKYKVDVNFNNDDNLKKVLLKTYHNLEQTHIEMYFNNKYEGLIFGHNRNQNNETLSKLKSYNIDLKKILIGDMEYLEELKEKIEFEKLTEDFSKLESFVLNENMFGSIKIENLNIPELKEAPSFFEKIKQKFRMTM